MSIPGYDAWKLAGPDDGRDQIGTEEGDACRRLQEREEGSARNPRPCGGTMIYEKVENCSCHISPPCGNCEANPLVCDTCGEEA